MYSCGTKSLHSMKFDASISDQGEQGANGAQRRGVAQGQQLASDKERKDGRSDVDKGRRGLLVAW